MRSSTMCLRVSGAAAVAALAVAGALGAAGTPVQRAKLSSPLAAGGEYLGASIAASGDTIVAGAPYTDEDRGAAHVFRRSGGTWTREALLYEYTWPAGDSFGSSVAISGDTALMGARGADDFAGAARVYTRTGTTWTEQAKLTAPVPGINDMFGQAVALQGDTAVVTAIWESQKAGAAYVFVRKGKAWTQQAKLVASDAAPNLNFGISAALYGDTLVVGAMGRNSYQGAAYVFRRTGTAWAQQATLTASNAADSDNFGYAVALSGDTAVIGANNRNSQQGSAYVFTRTGADWTQEAELTLAVPVDVDQLGSSVAVAGDTALVGASRRGNVRGAVYRFSRAGTTWTQDAEMTADDAAFGDSFGYVISLSGDTLAVGAYGKDSYRGAAYVFTGILPPSGYCLPARVAAKVNAKHPEKSTLTASGTLDTGSAPADFSGAATFDVGGFRFDVPAFVAKGRNLTFSAGGSTLTVTPARNGSSRSVFSAKVVADLAGKVDRDGPLTLRFANASHELSGTVTLTKGTLGPRCVTAPDLCVRGAGATVKGNGKDTLILRLGLTGDGTVPPSAADMTIAFGDAFTSPVLAGTAFVRRRSTDVYTAKGPGITKVTLDYAKGTITIVGSRLDLGTFDTGGNPVAVTVTLGTETRSARIRMSRTGVKLAY